jgi:hypothetical protein
MKIIIEYDMKIIIECAGLKKKTLEGESCWYPGLDPIRFPYVSVRFDEHNQEKPVFFHLIQLSIEYNN